MTRIRPMVVFLALCSTLNSQSTQRITRDRFMKAVEIGGISTDEFVNIIKARGVDFELNEGEKKKLAANGVDAKVLEAVARANSSVVPAAAVQPARTTAQPEESKAQVEIAAGGGESDEIVAGTPPGAAGQAPPALLAAVIKPGAPTLQKDKEEEEITAGGGAPKAMPAAPASAAEVPASHAPNVLTALPVTASNAVAVVVHKGTPVANLKSLVLRRIFTGRQLAWPDGTHIFLVNREASSDVRAAFYARVLKLDRNKEYLDNITVALRPVTKQTDSDVREFVAKTRGAIGYIKLSEVDGSVKVLSVDGVMPSKEALASRAYPAGVD